MEAFSFISIHNGSPSLALGNQHWVGRRAWERKMHQLAWLFGLIGPKGVSAGILIRSNPERSLLVWLHAVHFIYEHTLG